MLDVHEPIKPTGLCRTWPNLMTGEGVRGTEYEAWSEGNPPEHTTIIPFTRGLAGPIVYTPGIFALAFAPYGSCRLAMRVLNLAPFTPDPHGGCCKRYGTAMTVLGGMGPPVQRIRNAASACWLKCSTLNAWAPWERCKLACMPLVSQ